MSKTENPSESILEHKGDILFKIGQTENAVNYWQRAYNINKSDRKLENKIRQKPLLNKMNINLKLLILGIPLLFFASCRSHKMKNTVVLGSTVSDSVIIKTDTLVQIEPLKTEKVYFETVDVDFEKLKIKSKYP